MRMVGDRILAVGTVAVKAAGIRGEDSPIEYAPDEWESCDICSGKGDFWVCTHCKSD
ncbi:hypothetical protein [Chroococcidiopsis sp.]|uniref:hypothetical protein n=1 Tax=Chroococcidiopsis sp. TaxID=3088168 RepID=UPI003F67B9F4